MNDAQLRALLDGSPVLQGDGHISLQRASDLTGIDLNDLLHEAATGRLKLFCRVPVQNGDGFVMRSAQATRNPEGGWDIPGSANFVEGAYSASAAGQVLGLSQGGADVAQVALTGRSTLDLVAFDWGGPDHWFVPDRPVSTTAGELEVLSAQIEDIRQRWVSRVPPERIDRLASSETPLPAVESVAARGGVRVSGSWAEKPLSQALRSYCTDPDGLPASLQSELEQRQRLAGMMHLVELIGDKPLCEVTDDDLRAFRKWLQQFPANLNNIPHRLKRATITETISALASERPDWPRMSPGMQQERMRWLQRFFGWLHQKKRLSVNVAESVRGETGFSKAEIKQQERERLAVARKSSGGEEGEDDDDPSRRAFDAPELALIFSQPQFQTGHGRHVAGNQRCEPFEFWLPLLAVWHGLRRTEAAQLWLDDIKQVDGIWVLDINESTADKSLKTAQSKRQIPLRSDLIELGLLDYRARLKETGFQRLFPELRWRKDTRYGREPSRKTSISLERLGMNRDGRLVFHSYRHAFNGALHRVDLSLLPGMREGLVNYCRYKLMGHLLPADVNLKSYTRASIHELALLIEAVTYLELPSVHPFDVDWGLGAVCEAMRRKKGDAAGKEDLGPLGLKLIKFP